MNIDKKTVYFSSTFSKNCVIFNNFFNSSITLAWFYNSILDMASFSFNDLNQPPIHRICQIVNSCSWNILRNHLNWPPKVVIGLILLTILINFSLENSPEVFNGVEVRRIRWLLHNSSSYKPLSLQPSPRVLWHMWGSVILHVNQGLFPLLWLLFEPW